MVCVRCGKNYLQGSTAQLVWKPNIVVGNCGLWIAQVVVVVSRFDMQSNYGQYIPIPIQNCRN